MTRDGDDADREEDAGESGDLDLSLADDQDAADLRALLDDLDDDADG